MELERIGTDRKEKIGVRLLVWLFLKGHVIVDFHVIVYWFYGWICLGFNDCTRLV